MWSRHMSIQLFVLLTAVALLMILGSVATFAQSSSRSPETDYSDEKAGVFLPFVHVAPSLRSSAPR